MTDREIMELLHEGRREMAFDEIVRSYGERLYWHIRRFTNSHDDADDILQDTFMKAWKALPGFKEGSQIFTWIYRIATNESLNYIRKNKWKAMLQAQTLESIMESRIDEDPYFNGNALQRDLMKAVNRLPEKQKLVFCLRYFDDLGYGDIAEITGTSVGALKASYHFASGKIKAELENRL